MNQINYIEIDKKLSKDLINRLDSYNTYLTYLEQETEVNIDTERRLEISWLIYELIEYLE